MNSISNLEAFAVARIVLGRKYFVELSNAHTTLREMRKVSLIELSPPELREEFRSLRERAEEAVILELTKLEDEGRLHVRSPRIEEGYVSVWLDGEKIGSY